ncbi:MAG: DnaJ domain-containing protein [Cyanobacteria bacterium RI_101]|nr:DnaJ domain-containing protein [Cyanobacteria bacterium RI_101]
MTLTGAPRGEWIASAGADRTIKLWSKEGKYLKTLTGHGDSVLDLAFIPDSPLLASADADGVIRLWDYCNGAPRGVFGPLTAPVTGLKATPDGARLFSGAEDGTVARWNLTKGEIEETALAHLDPLLSLDLSPDGRLLVTASAGEVKLWDASRLTVLQTLPGAAPVRFSPDGQYLVCGNRPKGLKIWRRFNLSRPPWISIPNPRWWQVLGIAPTASPAEIRRKYHQLSRRYHPDLNPAPEAGAWMSAVNRAYESFADRG